MDTNSVWGSWGLVVASIVTLLVVRAVWVLQITGRALPAQSGVKRRPLRTLIVLGSGKCTLLNCIYVCSIEWCFCVAMLFGR